MITFRIALLLFATTLATTVAAAQVLRLQTVADNLASPLFATHAPGDADRVFIVQQGGQVLVQRDPGTPPAVYLNIADRVTSGGERGLLGMAFHPNFAENGHFYVNYTTTQEGPLRTRISRFTASGPPLGSDSASLDSEVVLLSINQDFNNHNAGMLAFSPVDGYLYIGTGDGGSGNDPNERAQDLTTLLGKMLRIDVDLLPGNAVAGAYAIPADNPFVPEVKGGKGLPIRDEIWAYGLRNPFRYSFDRETGDLWIGDVGQNAREEINVQSAASTGGENYGWRVFEGTRCNTTVETEGACDNLEDAVVFPIHEYNNPGEGRAVTGGYVYRGTLLPDYVGRYFFSDAVFPRVWSFLPSGGVATDLMEHTAALQTNATGVTSLASFGENIQGELYLVSLAGKVFKIVPRATGHSADQDDSGTFSLSELLRVIQFYNSDGYHCAEGTEDGYAPGGGNRLCVSHSADYAPQDWRVNLSEVLRTIELYNLGGVVACDQGEDGFCATG